MEEIQKESGFLKIGKAEIYYERSGSGTPLIMIHAGVADSRQWNNEFLKFSENFQTIRYDMRGYGKSEPVDSAFSYLGDLAALIDALPIDPPFILMGCSMGGGISMDYALAYPEKVMALIMVGSGPSWLELDVKDPDKISEAVKAYEDGNLDLVAELETQIWFDGMDRTPDQVNMKMRQLVYEMNRTAIGHEVKQLGQRQPDTDKPAFNRLDEINIPLLIIVGSQDLPYFLAAADYMTERIDTAQIQIINDAAHLSNMDQPDQFQGIVSEFLDEIIP